MTSHIGSRESCRLSCLALALFAGGCSGTTATADARVVAETGGVSGTDAGSETSGFDRWRDGAGDIVTTDLSSELDSQGDVNDRDVADAVEGDGDGSSEAASSTIRCVQQWPAPKAFASAPPLATTPVVLWEKSIAAGPIQRSMAVTRTRVAVTAYAVLQIFDRQGTLLHTLSGALNQRLSAPVADGQENLYFSDESFLYSVDKDGVERWRHPFGPSQIMAEFLVLGQSVISPAGVVYVTGADGYLWGLDTQSGKELLKVGVGTTATLSALPIQVGVGDSIFLLDTIDHSQIAFGTLVFGTDGSTGGSLIDPSGWQVPQVLAGPEIGIVGHGYRNPATGETKTTEVFDNCGRYLWKVPGDYSEPVFVGPRDELVVLDRVPNAGAYAFALRKFSKSGDLLAGPTTIPPAQVVTMGSDETTYVVACEGIFTPSVTPPSVTVVALSSSLQEQWRLPLGEGPCPSGAVLSDDGTLYIGQELTPTSNQLLAVRTTSPGVSAATWPQFLYGTYWLAP